MFRNGMSQQPLLFTLWGGLCAREETQSSNIDIMGFHRHLLGSAPPGALRRGSHIREFLMPLKTLYLCTAHNPNCSCSTAIVHQAPSRKAITVRDYVRTLPIRAPGLRGSVDQKEVLQ
jgi:hypothetical protein